VAVDEDAVAGRLLSRAAQMSETMGSLLLHHLAEWGTTLFFYSKMIFKYL
jgi:hypothetical protein